MRRLRVYKAALEYSNCGIARAVAAELGAEEMQNDLDVAREIIVKGDSAIRLSGATLQTQDE